MFPSIIEENSILPFFTDVTLIGGADLPTDHIITIECVELLMTQYSENHKLVIYFFTPTHTIELDTFQLELLALKLSNFILHSFDVKFSLQFCRGLQNLYYILIWLLSKLILTHSVSGFNLSSCLSRSMPDSQLVVKLYFGFFRYLILMQMHSL